MFAEVIGVVVGALAVALGVACRRIWNASGPLTGSLPLQPPGVQGETPDAVLKWLRAHDDALVNLGSDVGSLRVEVASIKGALGVQKRESRRSRSEIGAEITAEDLMALGAKPAQEK